MDAEEYYAARVGFNWYLLRRILLEVPENGFLPGWIAEAICLDWDFV